MSQNTYIFNTRFKIRLMQIFKQPSVTCHRILNKMNQIEMLLSHPFFSDKIIYYFIFIYFLHYLETS